MKTREDIEKNINGEVRYATEDYWMFVIVMEVLLDIRDLLAKEAK